MTYRNFLKPLLMPVLGFMALSSVPAGAEEQPAPAPATEIVKAVDIPYQRITLDNGLTLIVHEDRKAPVVAVSMWYGVGSKHEPKGKTGYAHLFEHIMFNGSEHAPGDYFEYLKQIGATDYNGTTWLDRTNYFQTVPRSALESALFLESDRMGYLLGGLTQDKLDNQIGVVQNEKRQGDNQPYGLVDYKQTEILFPEGHPYAHSTIGSMADLDAASLADMQQWFRGHYGPNNAVLVLAGDISVTEAKPLVEKWFGNIPAGPEIPEVDAPLPTLEKPVKVVMHDQVPVTRIYRDWVIPGMTDPDHVALDVGSTILGGLASSRLDNILVRDEQLAVSVYSYTMSFTEAGIFEIGVDVKPGVDADKVAARLDEIVGEMIAKGPTKDEVSRAVTREVAGLVSGLEQVGGFGGKAVTLAEGTLYMDDPEFYRKRLDLLVNSNPAGIRAAMQKWLTRPVAEIRVIPGEREAYQESERTADATGSAAGDAPAIDPASLAGPAGGPDRSAFPQAGDTANIDFPEVEEAQLSNGMNVFFARRDAVPVVRMAVSFDAGQASDPADAVGTNTMMTAMLDEGTTSLSAVEFAETQERLGAALGVSSSLDRTVMSARALKANLAPTVELFADFIRNPAFSEKELERVRVQQLTAIKSALSEPSGIAREALPALVYGADSAYGRAGSGLGDPTLVAKIGRDDLVAYHRKWIRPDRAEIYVVGDTDLETLLPLLESAFGDWTGNGDGPAAKDIAATAKGREGRIVVIDRPNSPQSYIYAGQLIDRTAKDDLLVLTAANDVMGGDFLSRINMDLRETKGWSYGSRSGIVRPLGQAAFVVRAPVQADRTGDAIVAIRQQVRDFTGEKGVTEAELDRTIKSNRLELAGQFEQSSAVLGQMQDDRFYGRPFDYVESLAARYTALEASQLDAEMHAVVDPDALTWVVVGDASTIRPQLADIDMPVEYRPSPTAPAAATVSEGDKE